MINTVINNEGIHPGPRHLDSHMPGPDGQTSAGGKGTSCNPAGTTVLVSAHNNTTAITAHQLF